MLLLVVDTSGATGGVLLARWDRGSHDRVAKQDGMQILGASDLQPRAFSAQLIPAIADLFQASQLRLADVDAFVVVSGPGSFTGLRVGLSAVKAMAEATGKPILTLSHLAIMASMTARLHPQESANSLVHVVLGAGRGEFYHGMYRNAGEICVAELFQTLDALVAGIQSKPGLVVASEPVVWDALGTMESVLMREIPPATVRDALPLAVVAWQAGDFHDPANVDANYLRRSDAVVVARSSGATQPAQRRGCES